MNNVDECDDNDNSVCVVTYDLDGWMDSTKGLTVLHLNIRSLKLHWDELKVILQKQVGKFDILVLSEISLHT